MDLSAAMPACTVEIAIARHRLPAPRSIRVAAPERLTRDLLDRLTHRVHIPEANGESYRLREAKTRQERFRFTPAKSS